MPLATASLTRVRRFHGVLSPVLMLMIMPVLAMARAGDAHAQNELSAALVQSTSLSDAQKQETVTYAASGLARFQSATWSESKQGRDQLLRPFEDPLASVAFRLEYSKALTVPLVASAAAGQPDITRLNAIRVLGSIATAQSTAAIKPHLSDPSPAIRFMATQAVAASFRALATSSPALPAGDAVGLVTTLATLVDSEQDVMVLDGAVIALVEATRVEQSGYAELREGAYTRLAKSVGARLRALPPDSTDEAMVSTVLRAGTAARDGLSIGHTKPSNAVITELAGFGGDLVAYVLRRAKAGQMPAAGSGTLRTALEQLVSVGEANIYFARDALGSPVPASAVADVLKSGSANADQLFAEQAAALIQATLTTAPLNLPADRFLK